MLRRIAGGCALFAFITVAGCGQWDGGDDLGASRAEVVDGVCDETDLSKPGGVCEGPWEYVKWKEPCYAEARHQECGIDSHEQVPCYNTCARPEFGISHYNEVYFGTRLVGLNYIAPTTPTKLWQWMPWNGSSCSTMGIVTISSPQPTSPVTNTSYCQYLANAERASRVGSYGSDLITEIAVGSTKSCTTAMGYMNGASLTNEWYSCTIRVKDPVYNTRTDHLCGVDSSRTCTDPNKPIYKLCRTAGNGLDPNYKACGEGTAKGYSSSGVTKTTVDVLSDSASSLSAPTCLTADNVQDVQGKYTLLTQTLTKIDAGVYPSTVDLPRLKKLVVGKLQLLLEMHKSPNLSGSLTEDQLQFIRGLYLSDPDLGPSCGTRWQPAPVPATTACNTPQSRGSLVMCDRLLQPHATPEAAAANLKACVDARQYIPGANICTDRVHLNQYVTTTPTLMSRAFSTLNETVDADRKAVLQKRLDLIQRWYNHVRPDGYTGDGFTDADLWRDSSAVTDSIVLGAYSNTLKSLDPSGTSSIISNADALASGYKVDRELLDAALSDMAGHTSPPLTKAPVLFLLADAFRPLATRLHEVDTFHDFGCRFKNCRGGFSSEVSQLHELLGSMGDGAKLVEVNNLRAGLVKPTWKNLFNKLVLRYDTVVKSALLDVDPSYTPASIVSVEVSKQPIHAFAEIVTASRKKFDNFSHTGLFRSSNADALSVGLTQAKLTQVSDAVRAAKVELETEQQNYINVRNQQLSTQFNYLKGFNDEQNATGQLDIKGALLAQLGDELDGYRTAATVDKERFGEMSAAYDQMIQRLESTWNTEFLTRISTPPFPVTPSDAKWMGGEITNISAVAVGPVLTGIDGDIFHIETSGSWAPTCALQKAANTFSPPLQVPLGAKTTSQGYYADYVSSTYRATAHTDERFDNWTRTNMVCAGASLSVSIPVGGEGGPSLGVSGLSAQACKTRAFGRNISDSTSDGTDFRTSAAFNSGIRVRTTPFPDFPAGALLAIRTVQGRTDLRGVIDVEVVQAPYTTLLVSKSPNPEHGGSSDIYLVVNDLKDSSCQHAADEGSLSVSVQQLVPKARFARQVQTAMATTYAALQKTIKDTILPQGAVLPTQVQLLQSEAMSNLISECNKDQSAPCDLAAYDRDLMELYRTWVLHALAQAERQVQLNRLERQMTVAVMEWEAMAADLEARKRETQLLALLPAWNIRNLDLEYLKGKGRTLVNLMETGLYPFLKVKYPEVLVGRAPDILGLNNNATAQGYFNDLTIGLDWSAEWTFLTDRAAKATGTVLDELRNAQTRLLKTSEQVGFTVAVAFKKPAELVEPGLVSPTDDGRTWLDVTYSPLYREASTERSKRVWENILQHKTVNFEILPSDLYNYVRTVDGTGAPLPTYDLQLQCHWSVPVIRSMGIIIANDGIPNNDQLNGLPKQISGFAAPDLRYVGAASLNNLYMMNNAWTNLSVPIGYGTIAQVYDVFWGGLETSPANPPVTFGAGEGLSPVGSFSLNPVSSDWLDPIASLYHRGAAFVVVMHLEFRDKGDSVSWLTNCQY